MKGGDLAVMPVDYVELQGSIRLSETYTAEGTWDVVDGLEEIGVKICAPVLMLGCSVGHECFQLRKVIPGRIAGVDIVPRFISEARQYSRSEKLGIEFHVADIHDLPFGDGEFDTVYSRGTLEHCYNLKRAVAEIQRVAGRLVVVTADLVPGGHDWVGQGDYAFSDDQEEWKALFWAPGWHLVGQWLEESYRRYKVLYMAWERDGAAA